MMRHHGMSWYFIGHSGTRWDLTHMHETWWDMTAHRHKYLHMKFGIRDTIVHVPASLLSALDTTKNLCFCRAGRSNADLSVY